MFVGDIEYLDEDVELFKDGSVHEATLARNTTIQGLPCAGGHTVVFFPSGQLRLAWLSSPAVIGAVGCAPGIVYLHDSGGLFNATLSKPHTFAGVVVPDGERVALDEEGRLLEYSNQIENDQSLGGLPCLSEFRVWLYPSGQPSMVVLAAPSLIDGLEYPRGAEVFLDENGKVLEYHEMDLEPGNSGKSGPERGGRNPAIYEFSPGTLEPDPIQ